MLAQPSVAMLKVIVLSELTVQDVAQIAGAGWRLC